MEFTLIYISGLILLVIIILTVFGYLVLKVKRDEDITKSYEELLFAKNNEIFQLQNKNTELANTLENERQLNTEKISAGNRVIDKLIVELDIYKDASMQSIMTKEDKDKHNQSASKTLKEAKKHRRKS